METPKSSAFYTWLFGTDSPYCVPDGVMCSGLGLENPHFQKNTTNSYNKCLKLHEPSSQDSNFIEGFSLEVFCFVLRGKEKIPKQLNLGKYKI